MKPCELTWNLLKRTLKTFLKFPKTSLIPLCTSLKFPETPWQPMEIFRPLMQFSWKPFVSFKNSPGTHLKIFLLSSKDPLLHQAIPPFFRSHFSLWNSSSLPITWLPSLLRFIIKEVSGYISSTFILFEDKWLQYRLLTKKNSKQCFNPLYSVGWKWALHA